MGEELAKIEGQMLEARDKSANLEYEIFLGFAKRLRSISVACEVGSDHCNHRCLQAFAVVAEQNIWFVHAGRSKRTDH